MDVSYMREVLVLAEHLSFTTAAAKLYLSQPTLTRHVNAVEEELGTQLFERHGVAPAYVTYLDHIDTLLPVLARTGGIFIGSMLLTAIPQQHHVFVRIDADDFTIDVALVYLKENANPNIARLIDCIPDVRKLVMTL